MTRDNDPFAAFDDDLSALIASPATRKPVLETVAPEIVKDCFKCRGTGKFVSYSGRTSGPCFACNGTGKHDPQRAKRQAAHVKGEQTKAANLQERGSAWKAEHPAEWESILDGDRRGNTFCSAMVDVVAQWGCLTDNQLAAVRRGMLAREAKRAEFQAARETSAPVVDVSQIEQAFEHKRAKGKSKLWLYVAGFTFTPAKPDSRNPGALYVKRGGEYLGKIASGKFLCTNACDDASKAKIAEIASDPKSAALAHGRETGQCAVCGRELSDPASVARGIGPDCAKGFGW
jgi:hypothetical protein